MTEPHRSTIGRPEDTGEDRKRQEPSKGGSADTAERDALDAQLDEELEDTFPASDPPSLTQEPHSREQR